MLGDERKQKPTEGSSRMMIHLRGRIQFLLLSLRNYVFLKQLGLAAAPVCVGKYEAGFDSARTIWGLREGSVWCWVTSNIAQKIFTICKFQPGNTNCKSSSRASSHSSEYWPLIGQFHVTWPQYWPLIGRELAHRSDTTSSWSFIGWYIPNMRMESRPIVVCVKISSWVRPRLHLPVNWDYLLSIHQRLRENFQLFS